MLTDSDLTDIVRTCGGPFPRERVSATFIRSRDMTIRWRKVIDTRNNEYLKLTFPDCFSDAPLIVIKELTKRVIQDAFYSSDYELSDETIEWIIDRRTKLRLAEVS